MSTPEQRILRQQRGLLRLDQASDVGISRGALRWSLGTGRWREVLPRVYATFTGDLSEHQRLIAGWLYAGPHAQVAALTALRVHGLRYLPPDGGLVHLLIPHHRRQRSAGFARLHRTTALDPAPWCNGGIPICSPARAVADAALACTELRAVRAMVAETVQRRMATVEELRHQLGRVRRNGSGLLRRAVREVAGGIRSAPEAELRETLAGSTVLPPILWNPRLADSAGRPLPTPDGWLDDVGIALEVNSREYHLSPADWEQTLARHVKLAECGALVLPFTPAQIRRGGHALLQRVERAYLRRRRAGVRAEVRVVARA